MTVYPAVVQRQLEEEPIVWLATVRKDGQPQVVPVWFLWDGRHVLVYSLPQSQKVRNIRHNPRVSLHFNSDRWANHVTRFDGVGELVPDAPPVTALPAYLRKYAEAIGELGMTVSEFATEYRALIRIHLERLVHW
ncbi:MAG: TIGR03667 family PPOX class F420-dependent oxidoreductase [Thermomicrobium sp.]|nr:TIGR03667 family PPOX class F420-dependent oxidoreductase [Thermomicrobium sp.]